MASDTDHVVNLWWAELRSVDVRLFGLLDAVESRRLAGIERDADRGRFVLGATLLRVAVSAATDVDPGSVRVERSCDECGGPHGAPRVTGVRVSVAHAGPLVLVGTATAAVGVDVEAADRGDDVERWVLEEARFKTGLGPSQAVTCVPVPTPWPGHRAALALAGDLDPDVIVHQAVESDAALARWVESARR